VTEPAKSEPIRVGLHTDATVRALTNVLRLARSRAIAQDRDVVIITAARGFSIDGGPAWTLPEEEAFSRSDRRRRIILRRGCRERMVEWGGKTPPHRKDSQRAILSIRGGVLPPPSDGSEVQGTVPDRNDLLPPLGKGVTLSLSLAKAPAQFFAQVFSALSAEDRSYQPAHYRSFITQCYTSHSCAGSPLLVRMARMPTYKVVAVHRRYPGRGSRQYQRSGLYAGRTP
jgi:hypothetical protein